MEQNEDIFLILSLSSNPYEPYLIFFWWQNEILFVVIIYHWAFTSVNRKLILWWNEYTAILFPICANTVESRDIQCKNVFIYCYVVPRFCIIIYDRIIIILIIMFGTFFMKTFFSLNKIDVESNTKVTRSPQEIPSHLIRYISPYSQMILALKKLKRTKRERASVKTKPYITITVFQCANQCKHKKLTCML